MTNGDESFDEYEMHVVINEIMLLGKSEGVEITE